MANVLLLNASYEPLKVISWQRAICLFFLEKVEVVEEYDHEIRSVSVAIKAPSVVRLLKYVKGGRRVPPFSRTNVLARDRFECQYCGKSVNAKTATLDHVKPRSRGGRSTWENVVCACQSCNAKKGSRLLPQSGLKLRRKPARPQWIPVLEFRYPGGVHPSWLSFLLHHRE